MKLMAFSDVHGDLALLKKLVQRGQQDDVELVVCAGDFTVFENQIEAVLKELDTIGKPVLLIPGNHEAPDTLEKQISSLKNIESIHEKVVRKNGVTFLGWGTDGFTRRSSAFRKVARSWRRQLTAEDKLIVLVTHAPPFGTAIDLLDKEHVGNTDLRKEIEFIKPVLTISGHIHETEGKQDKIGETLVVNPGKKGMVLNV